MMSGMDSVIIGGVALAFLAVGLGVGLYLGKLGVTSARVQARQEGETELATVREQLRGRDAQHTELKAALAATEQAALRQQEELRRVGEERARLAAELEAERKAAKERLEEAIRNREQVRAEVEKLAGRLLDEKGKAILDRNQISLKALLDPLGVKLKDFESKVEKTYDQENRDRARLLESLRILQDTQAKLHQDAEALTRALTGDSKTQGDWGELVLERVLETAGLTEGREYDLQLSHTDDEGGRKRPDALVYLPGNRVVVVDAKCSLTAFVEASRAVTAEAREAALVAHVASIRAHVKGLAAKSYQDVVQERTLDIVLLFVPNEAAFHAAISRAAGLYEEAFRQRIVICSPTTLLAALQLISHVWRSEKQNANAQDIAEEAGKMLEKLGAFVEDLEGVGKRLDQAKESYDAARSKLESGRGNLIGKAKAIARLGAPVKSERVQTLLLEGGVEEGQDD
jgi:DNA recombination protein RmuC